jgi:uncharacterized protein (TIGR02271 family)
MSSVLVGMFDSRTEAEAAKARLVAAGFASSALSLTGGGSTSGGMSGGASGGMGMSGSSGSGETTSADEPHHEGAIARFFDRLFGEGEQDHPERASYSEHYSEAFNRGSYGLTVTAADDAEMTEAERILNECGAVDIDQKAEQWKKEGWTGGSASRAESATGAGVAGLEAGTRQKLQEVEEELKVGKRAVARGGVRIFTRMTETPIEETVRLREERADVQRREVDRPATEADLAAFKEGSIEVREMSEEAVVSKSARVVGEVEIGKTATEREEIVRDTVRKTKVEVEKLGGSTDREPSSTTNEDGTGKDRI